MLQAGDLKSIGKGAIQFHNSVMTRLPTTEQRMVFETALTEAVRGTRLLSLSLDSGTHTRTEESYSRIVSAAMNFGDAARGFTELARLNSDDEPLSKDLLHAAQRALVMEEHAAAVETATRPGRQPAAPVKRLEASVTSFFMHD